MSKTWKPWNNVDYSSASHHPEVKQKAHYDSTPSKSIGGGCSMPSLEMEDAMWVSDPTNPSPAPTDIAIATDGIADGISREDRLAIVREWVAVKERELSRRKDARFLTTCFVPIPNELSTRDAVQLGHEMCQALFGGDHLYSFNIHAKETTIKKIAGGAVATYSRQNNHIHIIFSERRLSDGKKGTGTARKFKQHDALRKMINSALADSLIRRGYKITANVGADKRKRIHRVKYRIQEREEQQALAVEEAKLEAKQKRDEIASMDKEIEVAEREVATLEKARSKRPHAPQIHRPGIDFDHLNQGMDNLRDKVKSDHSKQKEARRERTQAPQPELDRNDRDGMDI